MRAAYCKLRHRVGWRGATLVQLAVFFTWYAHTRMISPGEITQQLDLVADVFPLHDDRESLTVWGLLWIGAAVLCLVSAFLPDDRLGYGAAFGIVLGWLGGNVYAWSQGLTGGGGTVSIWLIILSYVITNAMRPEEVPELEQAVDDLAQHNSEITGEIRLDGLDQHEGD